MSADGASTAPASYPPPVDPTGEFIKRGLDDEDELIEVGVAIVGGGTAGLSCANRLLQLLADDEELLESLGEVPVAVIEKAKTCGGHNLSGAVRRPEPLQKLVPDLTRGPGRPAGLGAGQGGTGGRPRQKLFLGLAREQWRQEGCAFGEVAKESVCLLPSAKRAVRIPTPPPFK